MKRRKVILYEKLRVVTAEQQYHMGQFVPTWILDEWGGVVSRYRGN